MRRGSASRRSVWGAYAASREFGERGNCTGTRRPATPARDCPIFFFWTSLAERPAYATIYALRRHQRRTLMRLPMARIDVVVLFEIIVLELLGRTGRSFGAARDRHTNLE